MPNGGKKKPADPVAKCGPTTCKLVSITVISNATQTDVTGPKNWAAVKKATDDVIVEATTTPNDDATWQQIAWSGDTGAPVAGHSNQRKLSRAASKKLHIQASLGGVTDSLDVWILWATVTVLTSGARPANAVAYAGRYDGTEDLGAKSYDSDKKAVGKVVPVAVLTPAGVHDVVKSGWAFRRERMTHDWDDGAKSPGYWDTAWVDDTSSASLQNLVPDAADKIYDRDAPNIANFGTNDSETYNNFNQWVEWHGDTCSDKAPWHWQGRWKKSASPQIELKDVDANHMTLPSESYYHPPAAPPSPGGSKGCFIATAAYGSPLADEVLFFQSLRDNALRRTRWGRRFFDEYWKYYYRLSPAIAAEIDRDPELRRIVRWSIVTPMLNYLKLVMARPADWSSTPAGPEWQSFLALLKRDMDEFLAHIELPEDFHGLSGDAAVDEISIAAALVLKEPAAIDAWCRRLAGRGALPLCCSEGERDALARRLRSAGIAGPQIAIILGGVPPS